MRLLPIAVLGVLGGLTISSTPTPHHYAYFHHQCVTKGSGTALVAGGASLATVVNADFSQGSSCAVIPPVGTPPAIALRCEVSAGSAEILASAPVSVAAPAGEWCVEVRTVAPAFMEP